MTFPDEPKIDSPDPDGPGIDSPGIDSPGIDGDESELLDLDQGERFETDDAHEMHDANEGMGKRWAILGAIVAVCVLIGAGVISSARSRLDQSIDEREQLALEEIEQLSATSEDDFGDDGENAVPIEPGLVDVGDLVFVNRVPGDDYGKLATIDGEGDRHFFGPTCDRAHASAGMALCLEPQDGLIPTWNARVLDFTDESLPEIASEIAARPSRARVDPRGSRVVWTSFVTGHDYLSAGEFATETRYIDFSRDGVTYTADQIRAAEVPERFNAQDGNWWGVTFDPSSEDHVYLTFGHGEETEVVRSDQRRVRFESAFDNASCPSQSPDGDSMVFKRAIEGEDAPLSLVLRGLNTGDERVLNEDRFVDDQVEWLDNDTITYGLIREDSADTQPEYDIWSLDITDPDSEPELLVPFADSPGIYRDAR